MEARRACALRERPYPLLGGRRWSTRRWTSLCCPLLKGWHPIERRSTSSRSHAQKSHTIPCVLCVLSDQSCIDLGNLYGCEYARYKYERKSAKWKKLRAAFCEPLDKCRRNLVGEHESSQSCIPDRSKLPGQNTPLLGKSGDPCKSTHVSRLCLLGLAS